MAYTAYLVQRGNRINYPNTGSLIGSKQVVVLASGTSGFCGISVTDIAATTGTGELAIGGGDERIWNLPKTSGQVYTIGQVLYWNASTGAVSSTATTTNTRIGRAAAAAASAATTVNIILNA